MEKLLLIDGNAIVHRAYHALPQTLTLADGTVINAVYGFFSMLFNVVSDLKPEYLIVTFDISKPTYRQSLYAGYQEHRPAMADNLSPQFDLIHKALKKMNVVIYELKGYEADDVIGTLAIQVARISNTTNTTNKQIETVILTGDRDLLQLVNEHTKVLMPITGVKETVLFDEAKVEEKYGVKVSQFVDYKALIGDPSDGYPGVTGIGPKTASSLLQKFKTFEGLYQHLGDVSPTVSEKLATDAEQAALAKKLATILIDVPVSCDMDKCKWSDFDTKGAMEVFEQYRFNSLIKRFGQVFKEAEDKKKGEQLGLL
jgi:DNA polymerase I